LLRVFSGRRGLAISWLIVGIVRLRYLRLGVSARHPCAEKRPRALHCAPFPHAKRNRAIRLVRRRFSVPDGHDAVRAPRPFN
jgi:hypothetical protein